MKHPALTHPPASLCGPCQNAWGEWAGYRPYIPITLMSIGRPVHPEKKRREVIAAQRQLIADNCGRLHTPKETP